MKIWFELPRPGVEPIVNRTCPACGHPKVHVHEQHRFRPIVDLRLDSIHQVRVKCSRCGKTATCRPGGITPGRHRSDAVVAFGILLYTLGLSCRGAAAAIRALAGSGSRSEVHRDVVRAGERARRMHERRAGKAVRVLGLDGTGQRMKGGSRGVAVAVDAEEQVLLGVELVEEEKPGQVRRFVRDLCRRYHVKAILTDEHDTYKKVLASPALGVDHRLCETHWKKSKQLRITHLLAKARERGWRRYERDLETLRRLIREDPPDAVDRIQQIHERYLDHLSPGPGGEWSLGYHMRMLTLHLIETWMRVGAASQRTNNTVERMIGILLKNRSKTMRGFGKAENIIRFVHLAAYVWENRKTCELRAVS